MGLRNLFPQFITKKRKKLSEKDQKLDIAISKLIGKNIQNVEWYQEAFSLRNASSKNEKNYERLEFLGDSILGSIIAFHLFETYPRGNEGYLTQMKSKIVSRKNLNKIGDELKLKSFIINDKSCMLSENISGNLFEALIGAVYMDIGYEACQDIILKKLLKPEDINKLENKVASYKSLLLEWSQKNKIPLKYETKEETQINKSFIFRTLVYINNKKIANATDTSKKKAEEKAAQRAYYSLNKKHHIAS